MKTTTTLRLQLAGLLQTIHRSKSIVSKIHKPKAIAQHILLILLCLVTLAGAKGWAQTNNALDMSGGNNDYIEIPHNTSLQLSDGSFSIEFWAKPLSLNTTGQFQWVVSKDNGNADLDYLTGQNQDNKWRFIARNLDIDILSTTVATVGTWYHVACTFDGTTARLYINGVLEGTDATVGSSVVNTSAVLIGDRDTHNGTQDFNGVIDEVRLWGDQRTQKEISLNMNNALTGSEANLVAYYPLNEGVANGNNTALTTVFDATSNNFNGTLNNFTKTGATSNFVAGFTAVNNALDFDGGSDFVTGTGIDHDVNNFTIEAWVYPHTLKQSFFVSQGGYSCTQGWLFDMPDAAGTLRLETADASTCQGTVQTGTGAIVANQWQHIAVSVTRGTTGNLTKIYVNGVQVAEGNIPAGDLTNTNLRIGYGQGGGAAYFDGLIDEVRVWNIARTCAQIKETKDVELTGSETGLVAYYNFNYGTASGTNTGITTLPDLSTNTNNGTLNTFTLSGAASNWVSGSGNNVSGKSPDLQPEINVQNIANGETTISTALNTFFPFTAVGANRSQTFTLQNTGAGTLTISSVNSTDPSFSVSTLSNLTAGNNTTFTITYAPTASGSHTSTITINSNDCDEAAYTFEVKGVSASGNANALNFDGTDDYVTSTLDGTSLANVTVEMWVNQDVTGDKGIFHWNSTINNTTPFIYFDDNSGTSGNFRLYVDGDYRISTSITAGVWTHFAATYDGADWRLYKNGQLVGTYTGGLAFLANANSLFLGRGGTWAWDGSVDEVRIWNDVRTQDEIIANMNNELAGTEANLVAYYNFNQGTAGGNNTTELTVLDASPNGNNSADISTTGFETGTPSTSLNEGATSNYVAGFTKINNALSFNGTTDYVATSLNRNAVTDYTLEAWIQYEGAEGDNYQPIIANTNYDLFIGKNAGDYNFGIQDIEYVGNINSANAFDGNWHHIAVTRSGTTVSLYVDGVFVYSGTFTGSTLGTFNIGHEPDMLGNFFFTGKIDEVRIWSSARTCAEINSTKDIELTGNETNLVAYYNFNHGTAAGNNSTFTTLPDISTNSNTGTLTNFAGLDGSVNSGQTSNWVDASGNNVSGTTPANQPGINVKGGSTPTTIADGDGVPETGDDTDFGSVYVGASKTVTYTIENTGTADLAITSIVLSGVGMANYSLGTLPTSVAAGDIATFDVTFTPSSVTTDIAATITINNATCDKAAYDFAIQGDGAQAAPGGVTSGLKLWLKADAGVTGASPVTAWADQSGGGLDATAASTPGLVSNGLNFNPVISFNGTSDRFATAATSLFTSNSSPVSMFTVFNTTDNANQRMLINQRYNNNCNTNIQLGYGINSSVGNYGLHIGCSNATLAPDNTIANNTYYLMSTLILNSGNSPSNINLFQNGTDLTETDDNTGFTNAGSYETTNPSVPIDIGVRNDAFGGANYDGFHQGNIGEIVIYTSTPTTTERQQIESYLGLKYGITKSGDYLASDGTTKMWDATAGAAYLNSIAGIGRDDASALNQKQSKSIVSDAALTIGLGTVATDNASNTNTFAADKKFMTWGHNGSSTDYSAGVDAGVPNAGVEKRVARVWQIQDGGVGNTQVKFDISQFTNFASFTATTAAEFVLLIDDDGTDFSNAAVVIASDFTSNVVTFNGLDFGGATKYISLGQWKGGTTSGEKGSYLTCNGTDQYVSTASLVTTARTNFTVEMWFQWDGTGGGDRTLFYNGDKASNNGYGLVFDGTNLVPLVDGNKVANTTTTIVANTWYHVALVGDGTNLKLYLNGKEENLASTALPATTPATGTSIGAEGSNNVFAGKIEEVRFWNVTRTEAQIREYIHLTLTGSENGIVAYYQFNASSGDAIDAIGGNNGTLQNSATRATSDCPVGKGRSVTNSITASGNQTFGNTGVAINFAAGVLPQGDVVVTQLDGVDAPTNVPTGITTYPSAYWVVRNYGANSSFTELTQVEFTIPTSNAISTDDESTPSNIGLYKRASNSGSGDAWTFMGGATAASASAKTITFATFSTAFTSFSQLLPGTINSGTSGLPVSLGNFEAVRQDKDHVLVRWETISEIDNAGFEVQKSENGTDYKILGFVDGAGNSNQKRSYQFTDVQASRSAYYRLKQIDLDGKFRYSPVKFVQGVDIQTLRVYPNPFTQELKLDLGGKGVTQLPMYVELYSAQGKRTLQYRGKLQQVQNAINQHVGTLKQGVYVLRVIVGNKAYIKRIMKQ